MTVAPSTAATSLPSVAQPVPGTPPAKKVWTNDDLSDLQGQAALSTVGKANSKPSAKLMQPAGKNKTANPYQAQITKLQAQVPPIDHQIADLQAVLSGNTVNSPRKYTASKPDDWQIQLDQLQKKRADIESQIQALADQARHSGVPTNTLP
jgi:peptidoglycan hydrolase CwlO-like protein